jgi:hypothetical protein
MCAEDLRTEEVFQAVLGVSWGASGSFCAEKECDVIVMLNKLFLQKP